MGRKPTGRPVGRPTKFCRGMVALLAGCIRGGIAQHEACRIWGIGPTTAKRWLRKGRADLADGRDSEFARFAELAGRTRGARVRSDRTPG